MKARALFVTLAVLAVCLFGMTSVALAAPLSFEVTYDPAVGTAPVDGRIIVIAANPFYADWGYTEPREVVANELAQGPPFWGKTVSALAPGATETLDTTGVYGYPLPTIAELPEGDYWVQAYLAKYTTFHRADGFTFKGFLPGGVSLDALDDPGALYSTPQMMHLTPDSGPVQLSLTEVVAPPEPVPPGGTPQQGNPPTTRHVKHVKIKSELLSAFWGQDMYIAADVLLPSGYFKKANAQRKYPVIYWTFHFPYSRWTGSVNPGGFVEPPGVQQASPVWWEGDARFSKWWLSGKAPQVIYVQIREENPYGEVAYQVDSPNLGPYDTAEKTELVPAIQKRFRIYRAGWARTAFGCSTGGWMAAAQQIFHPKYYAGAWVFSPDIMSFAAYGTCNLYADDNLYYEDFGWYQLPRPGSVMGNHQYATTAAQENLWEAALTGPDGRVANDWTFGLTQAVWGPIGPDGYYLPAWDKLTGTIDHAVTEQMKGMDLTLYTKKNWGTIGKDLRGKLHIYCGTSDNFMLDNGVLDFQKMSSKLKSPQADFDFHWVANARHVWWIQVGRGGGLVGLVRTMARTMRDAAPNEASRWWYATN